jgi:hypothetical protein
VRPTETDSVDDYHSDLNNTSVNVNFRSYSLCIRTKFKIPEINGNLYFPHVLRTVSNALREYKTAVWGEGTRKGGGKGGECFEPVDLLIVFLEHSY